MSDDLTPLLETIDRLNELENQAIAELTALQAALCEALLKLETMCPEGSEN